MRYVRDFFRLRNSFAYFLSAREKEISVNSATKNIALTTVLPVIRTITILDLLTNIELFPRHLPGNKADEWQHTFPDILI